MSVTFSTKSNSIDTISEVLIPLTRLLSDPNEMEFPIIGKVEGKFLLKTQSKTVNKTLFFSFENISLKNVKFGGKYEIG